MNLPAMRLQLTGRQRHPLTFMQPYACKSLCVGEMLIKLVRANLGSIHFCTVRLKTFECAGVTGENNIRS